MDTYSFIPYIKTDVYEDIAGVVKERFDTSNHYEINRPLLTGINKKVIGLMKDELGGKIMTEFVAHRPKRHSHLIDDGSNNRKAKGTKKMCNKKNTQV